MKESGTDKQIHKLKPSQKMFLDGGNLTTEYIKYAIKSNLKLAISEEVEDKIQASADLLQKFIDENRIIYGVNTSLGGFVNYLIPKESAEQLQENLISAVATNVGKFLDDKISRASILVRLNSLAKGASAISLENFQKLLEIYNAEIIPCIPCQGSLGASGDLGPLACIALVATGKWKAKYKGQIISGTEALKKAKINPMKLSYKEGLSLVNGTSTMAAYASLLVEEVEEFIKIYELISCLSFEGLAVKKKPFDPIVHRQKNHPGQIKCSENFFDILKDSQMIIDEDQVESELIEHQNQTPTPTEQSIEDAYSIRCTPQILGPVKDSIKFIKEVINRELNSASDNPLIIPSEQNFYHNGHFHGQYLAMAMDHLSIALTTLSNLSDRRIDRFMDKSNSNRLPPFLCKENPGIRLGLMGGQFMATSITAENRSLCVPLSIQTLTTTGDFQDIVSMGLIAARRADQIYNNLIYIASFELLCAAQAAEIRGKDKLSSRTKKLFKLVRKVVPYLSTDQSLTDYIEQLKQLVKTGALSEIL